MTQNEKIINHLQTYGSITPLDAFQEYGIMRLASRIADIKRRGYNITAELVASKNRFGDEVHYSKYTLIGE